MLQGLGFPSQCSLQWNRLLSQPVFPIPYINHSKIQRALDIFQSVRWVKELGGVRTDPRVSGSWVLGQHTLVRGTGQTILSMEVCCKLIQKLRLDTALNKQGSESWLWLSSLVTVQLGLENVLFHFLQKKVCWISIMHLALNRGEDVVVSLQPEQLI